MTTNNLDVTQQIVTSDGRPTPYLEEVIYGLVDTTGGEGDNAINDLQIIANDNSVISEINKLRSAISEIESNIGTPGVADTLIHRAIERIDTLEGLVQEYILIASRLQIIESKIKDLEVQVSGS